MDSLKNKEMIEQLAKHWLGELEQALDELPTQELTAVELMRRAVNLTQKSLKRLRTQILEKGFVSDTEEIKFFKQFKPRFYHWKIYFLERYSIERHRPPVGFERQQAWLEQEMHYVDRFFQQHQFFYEYFRLGGTDMDQCYFLRGASSADILLPELPELDPSFHTPGDYLFAKFLAFERLKDWLVDQARHLLAHPNLPIGSGTQSQELRWTGESINLAELAFGIHRTGQINNGTASIGTIFRWLEEKLLVSIGVPSKRLSEIRRRSTVSRTRYMEEMIEAFIQKIDKEDEYDPIRNQGK